MKKIISRFLAIIFILSLVIAIPTKETVQAAVDNNTLENMINTTVDYLVKKDALYGNEWSVVAIARSKKSIPSSYYDKYYKSVEGKIMEEVKKAVPFTSDVAKSDWTSITDAEKLVLALNSIGKDPKNVVGLNLVDLIWNREGLGNNGVSELAYALIALDSKNYEAPANSKNTRSSIITKMLSLRTGDGGFSWDNTAATADIDTTAMVVQALAKYYDRPEVKTAVDTCLNILKNNQTAKGDYVSVYGSQTYESPCTAAQVVVALDNLKKNPTLVQSGFVKTMDLIDVMTSYYVQGGGFKNSSTDETPDNIASTQLLYALVSYERLLEGKNSLYDLIDVSVQAKQLEPQKEEPKVQQIEVQDRSVATNVTAGDTAKSSEVNEIKTGDNGSFNVLLIIMAVMTGVMVVIRKKSLKEVR
ncbi:MULTISPECIES: prenyltransferase/squalene oxidase repeat-containing protein [Clostridium]|uniref:Terpene cyclase/mutase family protein n=1 Tax=Clostridium cibarium TaxID=2762247 RepID=A0ABR8PP23_9CLOT|nr:MULTISPECIES: prenyltransferase/squalene oxidase repeat-containing protein [Clostridium]MBD7909933.1 terpene cyclase/mutase family protein [Clostridium cibarium]